MGNLFEQMAQLEAISRGSIRYSRLQAVEREVASLAPTFEEAIDILEALQVGVDVKVNDHTPLEVTYAFADLRKALYKAIKVEPDDCSAYHEQQARDE